MLLARLEHDGGRHWRGLKVALDSRYGIRLSGEDAEVMSESKCSWFGFTSIMDVILHTGTYVSPEKWKAQTETQRRVDEREDLPVLIRSTSNAVKVY